jgi:NAD(P)-dependent dehydrogenase (short-subunit alcohol dehydrogenase family)
MPLHGRTVDTPQNRADMPKAAFDRSVKPGDIARVVAFLLSDAVSAASAVTAALLPVTDKT